MAQNLVQNADQSAAFQNPLDGINDLHFGGPTAPTAALPRRIVPHRLKMSINGGNDAAAGLASFQNTAAQPLIVSRCILDVTTVATAACTVSAGTAATAVSASNLASGQDVHTAAGTFGSTTLAKIPAGQFFTVSTASGASAGLVGYAYLEIVPATL